MPEIHIHFTLFSAFYSPLIMTMAGGFLEKNGLSYQWSVANGLNAAVPAVRDGKVHVTQSTPTQGFSSLQTGEVDEVVHFGLINQHDGFFITGREADDQFQWGKLEDQEVVVFKSGQPNIMFQYACHKAGIDYSKIKTVFPGNAEAIDDAFRSGQGLYVQQQGPFPQQLETDGVGHVVARAGDVIGPCAFSSLAARRDWLASDDAKRFTQAYLQAIEFLNTESADKVSALLQSWFQDTDLAALTACIASYQDLGSWNHDMVITDDLWDVMVDAFMLTGDLDKHYPKDTVCTEPPGI